MAIFPIRIFGDPVLRSRANEVETVDESVAKLMDDMIQTMRAAPGVGLAAPQIGILRRVIVWENEDESGALADPVIIERRGSIVEEEACLSLPGLGYPVERAQWVKVKGFDRSNNIAEVEGEDLTARIFQHEIDHLDGVLFIDHLPPDLQKEAKRKLREQTMTGLAASHATDL